jgi:hypothetical protein
MLERLQGRSFPKRLWQQQRGQCPGCGQPIVEDDRWVIQPAVPFKLGGARTLTNLKMLHPTCQRLLRVVAGKASGDDHRGLRQPTLAVLIAVAYALEIDPALLVTMTVAGLRREAV